MAGEVRDGARTLPRALAAGLALVTLAYAATSVAFLYAIPLDAMRTADAFAAQLGELLFGRAGGATLAAIVIVSALTGAAIAAAGLPVYGLIRNKQTVGE